MNIDTGKLFSLAELVPCQEGKIINRDIIQSPKMKFVVMMLAPVPVFRNTLHLAKPLFLPLKVRLSFNMKVRISH